MLPDLQRREFDWFAIDSEGNVALFASAGEGFIPEPVAINFPKHDSVADSLSSPNTGSAAVWSDYANQGLFVFDWVLPGGPYERRVVPSAPIAKDLKEEVMAIGALPIMAGSFSDLHRLALWPAT
jgi:hypothetical protein